MLQINKFPVIVREDLPIEQQAIQAGHAAIQFQHQHFTTASQWHNTDNRLIYLAVSNEQALLDLQEKAEKLNILYSSFIEPDIDNSLTAIALSPTNETQQLTKHLPLAFKKYKHIKV